MRVTLTPLQSVTSPAVQLQPDDGKNFPFTTSLSKSMYNGKILVVQIEG